MLHDASKINFNIYTCFVNNKHVQKEIFKDLLLIRLCNQKSLNGKEDQWQSRAEHTLCTLSGRKGNTNPWPAFGKMLASQQGSREAVVDRALLHFHPTTPLLPQLHHLWWVSGAHSKSPEHFVKYKQLRL